MKLFIILATFVVASSAWVILPGPGDRPVVPPPKWPNFPQIDPIYPGQPEVDPLPPTKPEVDPIYPEVPLPPGISPEVPVIPPKPELPKPLPPFVDPSVHSEVLNFPSEEDPQIRVHINIKQDKIALLPVAHRVARSLINWPGIIWPGLKPNVPEAGNKPEIPGGNFPEVGPPPTTPELDPPSDIAHTYIYPNAHYQLVKLRVKYNAPAEVPEAGHRPEIPISPYKMEFPGIGNKPALPEAGHRPELPMVPPPSILPAPEGERPIIPMPMPPIGGQKNPMVELFLDIGEQENY